MTGEKMVDYATLRIERAGPCATLYVHRPDKLNALNPQVLSELAQAVAELGAANDPKLRALVLAGSGDRAFVAGADIDAMQSMSVAEAHAFSSAGQRVAQSLEAAPFAVIAAVEGFALGGGCELALCADFIIAGKGAKFGQPEVKLGLIPGFGGTARLQRRIGVARARQLIFTGTLFGAEAALSMGLANEVVEAGAALSRARAIAEEIAARAPLAVAAAKRVLRGAADADLDAACALESATFASLFATRDAREGLEAFVAKRNPEFEGS
ncbi:MAG TPA: enoyl-CoA hydratase-related protein [Polyangiaceae bacterium]